MIEAYPFARRAFRRELEPLLAAARLADHRALVLCSLRDIVVAPAEESARMEIVARVRADFDAVLVHGDPRLIALEESFALASEIADRLIYTGYVNAPAGIVDARKLPASARCWSPPVAELSVGPCCAPPSERDGSAIWPMPAGVSLRGLICPAAEFAALHMDLPEGVIVERYRSDFSQMFRRCRVSVSQAGYNTVLDIISARIPAVLVPFAEKRETEQTLRAERLAACGVIEMLRLTALSPERLADTIKRAVRRAPAALKLDMAGAHCAAVIIARMISIGRANRHRRKLSFGAGD